MKSIQSLVAIAAAAVVFAGCAGGTYQKGGSAASSIQKAANDVSATSAKVGAVMSALNDLINRPKTDLKSQFKEFSSQVSDLESSAHKVADTAAEIEKRGTAYFDQWDTDIAAIQNEEIKNRSASRRADVMQRFQNLKTQYQAAKAAFTPFMADIHDIQKALGADLTLGGIDAIKSFKQSASNDALPVRDALDKLAGEFTALGVAMSASGPQTEK